MWAFSGVLWLLLRLAACVGLHEAHDAYAPGPTYGRRLPWLALGCAVQGGAKVQEAFYIFQVQTLWHLWWLMPGWWLGAWLVAGWQGSLQGQDGPGVWMRYPAAWRALIRSLFVWHGSVPSRVSRPACSRCDDARLVGICVQRHRQVCLQPVL